RRSRIAACVCQQTGAGGAPAPARPPRRCATRHGRRRRPSGRGGRGTARGLAAATGIVAADAGAPGVVVFAVAGVGDALHPAPGRPRSTDQGGNMTTRRQFVLTAVPATALLLGGARAASAQPAKLEESDPAAMALGYKMDATKVD